MIVNQYWGHFSLTAENYHKRVNLKQAGAELGQAQYKIG